MADDTIYNYVQGFLDGKYSQEMFWSLARFKNPTHQISFHTKDAEKNGCEAYVFESSDP